MWLIHTTALLLQNLRCVIHRQLGELKDIAVFEMKSQISVRYCRGDGRSRTIHVSFCSRDSSPALTMAALIRLSTSLIRTSDNEKKKNLHWAIQFPSSTRVKYIQQRTRIKDVCHVKIKRTWTSGRTVDIHPLLITQQNHDRLMNSVSTNRWGW